MTPIAVPAISVPAPRARATSGDGPHDAELMTMVNHGHEPALGLIYQRYSRLVYAISLRMTGSHEAAEEVAQDVFQAVWQSAGSFHHSASLAAWLVGITRHRAIDHMRSRYFRWRQRETLLDDRQPAAERPAETLIERETVRGALDSLPPHQRQALALAFYGGLTHNEIAQQLGQPVGTIKSRIRMGLSRLRELLE